MSANKVKGYRAMLGITQKELADRLGVTIQSVSNKERGITAFTDNEKVVIKKMLEPHFPHITIDEIFFDKKFKEV